MKWHSKEGRKSEDQPVMAKHSNWALNVGCVRWEHRLKKSLEDWPALIDIPIWAGCTISGNTLLIVCHLCLYPWVFRPLQLVFPSPFIGWFFCLPLAPSRSFPQTPGTSCVTQCVWVKHCRVQSCFYLGDSFYSSELSLSDGTIGDKSPGVNENMVRNESCRKL